MAISACLSCRSFADEALPSIEEIRAAYVQSLTSIPAYEAFMQVKWQTRDPAKYAPHKDSLTDFKIRLLRDGDRMLKEIHATPAESSVANRITASFDGRRYYYVNSIDEGPEGLAYLPTARIGYTPPVELRHDLTVMHLSGAYLCGSDRHLRKLLEDAPVQVVGWEMVDGVRCVKVDIGPHIYYTKSKGLGRTIAWFDPQFGFLPRKCFSGFPQEANSLEDAKSGTEVVTEEYRNLRRSPGAPQWVPVRGVMRNSLTELRLLSTEITVTSGIPVAKFHPQPPAGARVSESDERGASRGWVAGGDTARHELYPAHDRFMIAHGTPVSNNAIGGNPSTWKAKAIPSGNPSEPPRIAPPSAVPQRSFWSSVVPYAGLLGLCVLIAAAGLWFKARG